jgi:hypothetical protein
MGEAKRKRKKTFRQHMGLKLGDTLALKFFTPPEFAEFLAKAARDGGDEETLESVLAGATVLRRTMSGGPIHCLLCHTPAADLGLMGLVKSASKNSAVVVVCRTCLAAADNSDELRSDIDAALGVEEMPTSTWAS